MCSLPADGSCMTRRQPNSCRPPGDTPPMGRKLEANTPRKWKRMLRVPPRVVEGACEKAYADVDADVDAAAFRDR